MNVINPLKLLLPHQATTEPPEGGVVDVSERESRSLTQLELYSALLDRSYLHQLAAQAVLSNRPCQEAEQTLDELAKLSLERLKSDYEKRQEFIERGRERAKIELDEALKPCAAPNPPAAHAAENSARAVQPACDQKCSEQPIPPASAPAVATQAPAPVPPTPSAREKELEQELAEAQNEKRGCADRLSTFERLGYSPRRSTAMRFFGTTSLAGSAIALAIVFDSLTRDFPLFREMIDGMRAAFFPSEGHSQSAVMLGFVEVALLFFAPLSLAGFLFRRAEIRTRTNAAPVKRPSSSWIWGLILLGAYVIALVATFSTGETASRLLLDFALSLGVTGVSASLVFFSVTRSGRTHEEAAERSWWEKWERTLLPFAAIVPLLVMVLALTASFGPWIKLIPASLLACVLMIGALALAYGMLFRDLESEVEGCDARIAALKTGIEKERQISRERAESANAKLSAASAPSAAATLGKIAGDAVENVVPQIIKTMDSHNPQQYAAAIREILKPALEAALPAKKVESAEKSLRAYEAAITHLENRYSELLIEHATGWAKARIELRTAYALCCMGMKVRPHAAAMEPSLALAIDKSLPM